ncbi:MAG: L-threonylcarbamoyladenylate synthase [Alphaproteobacteria bacterium]
MPVAPATPATLRRAGRLLRSGRLVVFPTETVYGLGADATNDKAVAAVFETKGRPRFNPLIVHLSTPDAAHRFAKVNARAERLARSFWPGPLSLVLPRREDGGLSLLVSAGLPTVALRVPDHSVARALIGEADRPVAAPSANPSGYLSPTTAAHVAEALRGRVALIVDGGPCPVGVESTVIDVSRPGTARLLRPGAVTREVLETVIGRLEPADPQAGPRAPGMLRGHYAPRLPLRLDARQARPGEALLAFGPDAPVDGPDVRNLSPEGDLIEAAANLFRMLHELDQPRFAGIAVMAIPEHGLGAAMNDRLRRAVGRG